MRNFILIIAGLLAGSVFALPALASDKSRLIAGHQGAQNASLEAGDDGASVTTTENGTVAAAEADKVKAEEISNLQAQLKSQAEEIKKLSAGTPVGNIVKGANYVRHDTSGQSAHGANGGTGASSAQSSLTIGVRKIVGSSVSAFSQSGRGAAVSEGGNFNDRTVVGYSASQGVTKPLPLNDGRFYVPLTPEGSGQSSLQGLSQQATSPSDHNKDADSLADKFSHWDTIDYTGPTVYASGKVSGYAAKGGSIDTSTVIKTELTPAGADNLVMAKIIGGTPAAGNGVAAQGRHYTSDTVLALIDKAAALPISANPVEAANTAERLNFFRDAMNQGGSIIGTKQQQERETTAPVSTAPLNQ